MVIQIKGVLLYQQTRKNTEKLNKMKNSNKNYEQLENECHSCLENLLKLDRDHLKDELEQLLLSLQDKGADLSRLNDYLLLGGCRQK